MASNVVWASEIVQETLPHRTESSASVTGRVLIYIMTGLSQCSCRCRQVTMQFHLQACHSAVAAVGMPQCSCSCRHVIKQLQLQAYYNAVAAAGMSKCSCSCRHVILQLPLHACLQGNVRTFQGCLAFWTTHA